VGKPSSKFKDVATLALAGVGVAACLGELWKFLVIRKAFRAWPPPSRGKPEEVSILQPVTKGTTNLRRHLKSRVAAESIVAGDESDLASRRIADEVFANAPRYLYLKVPPAGDGGPAIKTTKMRAALAAATKGVVLFVDDDIILPSDAVSASATLLADPKVGVVFGVAYADSWNSFWSSLLSAFVNRYAFPSYLPLAQVLAPFTVTGHWFALRRADMLDVSDEVLEEFRIDDDHELARVLRARGLRLVQTPLVHQVENRIPSAAEFHAQMKRWFVFVRERMTPHLSRREQWISGVLSLPEGAFPLVTGGALLLRSRGLGRLAALLAAAGIGHAAYAARKADRSFNLWSLLLTPLVSLFSPLYIAGILVLGDNRVRWRRRIFEVRRDGKVEW
jgi:ceramide glucosyltransferase